MQSAHRLHQTVHSTKSPSSQDAAEFEPDKTGPYCTARVCITDLLSALKLNFVAYSIGKLTKLVFFQQYCSALSLLDGEWGIWPVKKSH